MNSTIKPWSKNANNSDDGQHADDDDKIDPMNIPF
jgi:hypothetical protein